MTKIAIIPARGGSKRIPRKNIKLFLGKPIIAYSIETALKSGLFDEVIVSTDDEEIAKLAIHCGAKVPFMRSKENSDDFATTFDVIKEVLNWYNKQEINIDFACCIYPTAPFITVKLLINAYNKLTTYNYDSIFPVTAFSYPIQRALKIDDTNGKMQLFTPKYEDFRSQDLEKSYHDVGQFYFFHPRKILQKSKLWTDNTGVVIIDEMQAQDIDTEVDWKLAELKYQLLNDNKNSF